MKIRCKGCNSNFIISDEELALVKSGDIQIPDRCDDCLERDFEIFVFRKELNQFNFSNADKLFYSQIKRLIAK